MESLPVYAIALFFLLVVSAFFSGSEAALFSLTRSQISRLEGESAPGREVARLLKTPRRALITILIGNLVVNVFSTSMATAVAVATFGDSGVGIAFLFMSVLILVFGEILPKLIAIHRSQQFSLLCIYPLRFFHLLFYAIQAPISRLTDAVIETLKKRLGRARRHFSKEELLTAFHLGHKDGHIDDFAYELMRNIIEFRSTVVREIMTPSISVFSLPIDMSREEMEEQIARQEFSRVPLYGDTPDDVRGVLHIKDLTAFGRQEDLNVKSIMRPTYYVPESTRISELFKDLGRRRAQLALVMDEYGSFVGIVTMEDILEELVGEIRDANEPERTDYTMLDESRIVVLGTMEIDDFNDVFGCEIEDEEHETIAGYVIGATGDIPQEGQTLDIGDLRFHIISAHPNRIRKMRVERR